jgi:hypothetical protein
MPFLNSRESMDSRVWMIGRQLPITEGISGIPMHERVHVAGGLFELKGSSSSGVHIRTTGKSTTFLCDKK